MKRIVNSTQPISGMAKECSQGVFWVIDDELLSFPFGSVTTYDGIAKSGDTYNHKRLWPDIKPPKCNKPYNYYPRGRVDINSRGEATVYMSPDIDESILSQVKIEFGIRGDIQVCKDYSEHYKCYLDDGWVPEK